jgi:signal transduction histidine kinase
VNQYGIAFAGLTILVAGLLAVLVLAFQRFSAAARSARGERRPQGGDPAMLSAALHDAVTKLKTQEAEMRTRAVVSEQLSRDLVISLTAGLLVVDRTGRIEILNPAGRRMIACPDDPTGRDCQTALASVPPLVAVVEECLATGTAVARRAMQVPDREPPLHLGVTVSPLRGGDGGDGALRGVICLFSDISTVAELEEQLRLKETLARLGELTAGLAHEFRNGLATIHGYGRLLDPQAVPPQYRPYIEGIRQECQVLGEVVTNFLRFARPEQISLTAVDAEAIARRAVDELRHELPEQAQVDVTGEFGTIQGDEVMLRQVFGNLVRNAVEACEHAGVSPVVNVHGEIDGGRGHCRITIDDNGPGIPLPVRNKAFQPFFTTRDRGTGLGLAIVQKIMVLHNGRVTIGESAAGGASIQLTFPLSA